MPALAIVAGAALLAALGFGTYKFMNTDTAATKEPPKAEIWKGVDVNYQAKDKEIQK